MLSLATLVLAALLVAVYLVAPFLLLLLRQRLSPLRLLRGPPSPSFFMGNLAEMHDQENNNLIQQWEHAYGSTFVYRGFIGGCRLMTTDPAAVAHILGHAYDYPKPDFVRDSLATMAAGHDGLLTVEGEDHKRQRKILTPAFTSAHIRSLAPIFWDKANQLRDIWLAQTDNGSGPATSTPSTRRVDALSWLGRATLDVIGLAGFGYTFDALASADHSKIDQEFENENELAQAFSIIFSTARKFRVMTILQRRNTATMIQAQATMRRIGLELIEEKRQAVMAEMEVAGVVMGASEIQNDGKGRVRGNGSIEGIEGDKTTLGRDLLSVLIRSNLSSTPSQRMSVGEVLCQISTFIAAGHETTASALTWCLYALARNGRVQERLREALRGLSGIRATGDASSRSRSLGRVERKESKDGNEDGNEDGAKDGADDQATLTERIVRCEYLDWVVHESLRVHAPVTNTMRVCMREVDEIPVSGAGASEGSDCDTESDQDTGQAVPRITRGAGGYLDRYGQRRWTIRVNKWDIISVPIQAINKSKALWGEDAGEFKPERWSEPPASARAIPGLYANTLTFLNGNPLGGNRACIGYQFALIEIKIFLYALLKDIEFTIDPAMIIEKKVNVVTRPFVKSEPHLGNQMPLNIRRAPP